MLALARTLIVATALTLPTAACSRRDLPDDPVRAPLATGIPNAAAGAVGASFEPPPAGALAPPRRSGPSKAKPHSPAPPPDPFGTEGADDDGEGGSAPSPPPKPPPAKGLAL